MLRKQCVAGVLIGVLALVGLAAEPRSGAPTSKLTSRLSDAKPCSYGAVSVDFQRQLGLNLHYLKGLGERISQARRTPDPIDLALAAQSLAIAEKLSGKTAPITADGVLTEAVEIAKRRGVSVELVAVALVVSDERTRAELHKQSAQAKEREDQEKARIDAGAEPMGIWRSLTVFNNTNVPLLIHINAFNLTPFPVPPFGSERFDVNDDHPVSYLEAFTLSGLLVEAKSVPGNPIDYQWAINP